MHIRTLVALIALAPTLAHGACKLARIAEWPVKPESGRLIVEGAINGRPIGVLLDTGAQSSTILRSEADRLGLTRQEAKGYRAFGVGGETAVEFTVIDELKIGNAARRNLRVFVMGERSMGRRFSFLLGYDFFEQVDVEFDLANHAVRLFQPQECGDANLAYWAKGGASIVPMVSDAEKPAILVDVKLNGKTFLAELDTGAGGSVVGRGVVGALGLSDVVAAGTAGGIGPARSERGMAAFESFALGDEVIRNPNIAVTNLSVGDVDQGTTFFPSRIERKRELREMFLGLDFLRAHRVYVSHSQRRLYFTYEGGRVFAPPAAQQQ